MTSLKQLREGRGLSVGELAILTGLRPESLSRIEHGRVPRSSTIEKLAKALRVHTDTILEALYSNQKKASPFSSWKFLKGLDGDLRKGLLENLVCSWTHHSTGLEGNTISEGDTHLVLTEGLTVAGKSLREHQEIHGHGNAIRVLSDWLEEGRPLTTQRCHELHRHIQTETVFDIYSPIGTWKVEVNGTMAKKSNGEKFWHEYSSPAYIPTLMDAWIKTFTKTVSQTLTVSQAVAAYTKAHVGFVSIHPYTDGNGRMARLLANLPLLKSGLPPLVVSSKDRSEYMCLLGDYCSAHASPTTQYPGVREGDEFDALIEFFEEQWHETQKLVSEFRQRQDDRLNMSMRPRDKDNLKMFQVDPSNCDF